MAFTTSIIKRSVFGDLKVVIGTFANTDGDSGGAISTELRKVFFFQIQNNGAAAGNASAVNETAMPTDGDSVTIATTANISGTWIAIGV